LAFEEKSSYRFEFFAFRDKGVHFEKKKNPSHSNPEIQNKSNYQPKIVHFVMVDEASSIPLMPRFT